MSIKRLFKFNKRDYIGLFGWWLVSFMIGIFAIPIMIGREVYQWKKYHLPSFEWDDIVRYDIVIIATVSLRYLLLGISAFELIL